MRRCFVLHHVLLAFVFAALNLSSTALVTRRDGSVCSCGFQDSQSHSLFTESIIIYMNETSVLPDTAFEVESYENAREKCWNCIFRQGASPSNVQFTNISNSPLLNFYTTPPTSEHLVVGGGIRTIRQDIQYGSFRSLMLSPSQNASGGSALSMIIRYNNTESMELSLMNTDNYRSAWVGTFIKDEFPTYDLGINYTTLGNGSSSTGIRSPWKLATYKIDWTEEWLNFSVGTNVTRSITKTKRSLPQSPGRVYFKHWSTGNKYSMGGPPQSTSFASVGWIRLFFNSSAMNSDMRMDFDKRCSAADTCSMDDWTLRGSTPHPEKSEDRWTPKKEAWVKRVPAIVIAILCISTSISLVIHALAMRLPKIKPQDSRASTADNNGVSIHQSCQETNSDDWSTLNSSHSDHNESASSSLTKSINRDSDTLPAVGSLHSSTSSTYGEARHGGPFESHGTTPRPSNFNTPRNGTPWTSRTNTASPSTPGWDSFPLHGLLEESGRDYGRANMTSEITATNQQAKDATAPINVSLAKAKDSDKHAAPALTSQRQRIDHLAGLVALCAIVVTVMHFGLTFVPAIIVPGAPFHSIAEVWVQRTISPFVLNQMWLGVFFTTSSRFLVSKYLKDGNLKHVAQAAVRRTPRLMIPVTCLVLFEYFLIDVGATKYLEYVPSLSWSTWPYVTRFVNFGHFISAVLELVFLIPNGFPQITYNYCTGVLWTIAVQLQGSWLVLLGAVVVREIGNPYKRIFYYAFSVAMHWYAQSWGSYLWLGVLLTDLDVTYKWTKWLHARLILYYSVLLLALTLIALGFAANVIPNWTSYNFPIHETNMHPDPRTGLPIGRTPRAGYPDYFVPRLNGLAFAAGMQVVVEISPLAQNALSWRGLVTVFPHIFTIYLVHGLIFWSWGAWLLCFLADRRVPWGANVAAVGITSYVWLAMSLPVLTPVIESLGRDVTNRVWRQASESPPRKRTTLFPLPEGFLKKKDWTMNNGVKEQSKGKSKCKVSEKDCEFVPATATDKTA